MKPKFIYSPRYDISPPGVGFLHPFDGKKYSKAWALLNQTSNIESDSIWQAPAQFIDDELLLNTHSAEYLESLNSSSLISQIIEIPFASLIPNGYLQRYIIQPVKMACEGTRLATRIAMDGFIAMNIGGGYHHAHASRGEGFCIFADAAIAIKDARQSGLLTTSDKILMIDLDAHRGNGFESIFINDPSVKIFDIYNFQVYPGVHEGDPDDYPFILPLKNKTNDEVYLSLLKKELPKFLSQNEDLKLVIYNAGSDILADDPIGNLNVSYEGVVERERFVIETLSEINVPTVIMTSGGYTKTSYKLVAELGKIVLGV